MTRGTPIALLLFFLSGATSLTYQVLWVRELQLVFGTSTFAISTVLAAFMAGLSCGGFAMGRYADRLRRPLLTYGTLEIGIGLYALIFPWLVAAVTPVYLEAWRAMRPGPVAFGAIQFALVGATLLVPTAAMGATLPLLARFRVRHLESAGARIGTLYAVNTFGAAAGTLLCGFVLLPRFGRALTTAMAVGANIVLGLGAWMLHRWTAGQDDVAREGAAPAVALAPTRVPWPVPVALGLAGFSVLVYEVAWTRLLGLILGGSAYTFSLMLAVFLTGIAIGGKVGGWLTDHQLTSGGRARLLVLFAGVEVGIAVLSYASMYLYSELPFWYVWLFDVLNARQNPEAVWWVSVVVAAVVMAPPTILMGMHFPIAVRAVIGNPELLGRPVGTLYGANTLGGVLGAFLAGFILLPALWMQGTILIAALAGLTAAAVLLFHAGERRNRRWLPMALAAVALALLFAAQRPPWNPLLMTAGLYHYVTTFDDHSRAGIEQYSTGLYDLLFYEEGLTNVVTVARNRGTSHLWLANNGKVDASTTSDLPTEVLLSALPMQFVDTPENVLIVGLASGISAGTVSLSAAVKRISIVEIEPAVTRAAVYFADWNRHVLSDPRVEMIHNDARNHLLLTPPQRYDIVVSEPSNPWISGVANLFTREFLQLGKTRLKPGGIWSQWIQTYGMESGDLQSLLGTFADVYPNMLVYAGTDYSDLVVIGSEAPLDLSEERTRRLLEGHGVTADLGRVGIRSTLELAALFLMRRPTVREMVGDTPLNTDNNMRIEYAAPLNLHRDTRPGNFRMLLAHAELPADAIGPDPSRWRRLAESYAQRRDTRRYRAAMDRVTELEARADGRGTRPAP